MFASLLGEREGGRERDGGREGERERGRERERDGGRESETEREGEREGDLFTNRFSPTCWWKRFKICFGTVRYRI